MLIGFFLHLKAARLPVSTREFLTLLEALEARVVSLSLDDFYHLARASLIKDEAQYDRYDLAFATYFNGVDAIFDVRAEIPEEWLRKEFERLLSAEDKAKIEALGGWDKLMETFRKRLEEQKGRHAGGNKWIGTGGTSPFGAYGYNPEGIRVGPARQRQPQRGQGVGRAQLPQSRRRRRAQHAQHQGRAAQAPPLRARGHTGRARHGRHDRRHGEERRLSRPPSRPRAAQPREGAAVPRRRRLDGSARLASARSSSRRRRPNSVISSTSTSTTASTISCGATTRAGASIAFATWDILHKYGPDWKVIFVGDAAMSPYELVQAGGSVEYANDEPGALLAEAHRRAFPARHLVESRAAARMGVHALDADRAAGDRSADVPADARRDRERNRCAAALSGPADHAPGERNAATTASPISCVPTRRIPDWKMSAVR